ncbi:hypothetical protein PUN28_009226 [Cardiocondyla obscurior]|uniref:Ribosomal protein L2 n=1 Tax=Cardiocondyla obscurior TaxID=286306 RepID=A0AAW2FW45_9HYME
MLPNLLLDVKIPYYYSKLNKYSTDSTLTLKEGPTRHSADILRREGGPGRVSCIGGATFSHRQNFRTPLKLIQIGKT